MIVFVASLFTLVFTHVSAFYVPSKLEPVYGSWHLQYSTDPRVTLRLKNLDLTISPFMDQDRASVCVSWNTEKFRIVVEKTFFAVLQIISFDILERETKLFVGEMRLLRTQQTIQSVWFIGLPYFRRRYNSSFPTIVNLSWVISQDTRRLYISYQSKVYVFERIYMTTSDRRQRQPTPVALTLLFFTDLVSEGFNKFFDFLSER